MVEKKVEVKLLNSQCSGRRETARRQGGSQSSKTQAHYNVFLPAEEELVSSPSNF